MKESTRPPTNPAAAPHKTPMTTLTTLATIPISKRDAAAPHHAHQEIAAQIVGAENMPAVQRGRRIEQRPLRRVVVVGRNPRNHDRGQHDHAEQDAAGHRGAVVQQAGERVLPKAAAGGRGGNVADAVPRSLALRAHQ